ncbi:MULTISPECIES: hypothetical protein, partial [unclassified Brevundimonas]|uniref:hypothetical protein n=1 Tax=unclassified Brevundimonas TaxID=2622653 RepID=UPI001E376CFD
TFSTLPKPEGPGGGGYLRNADLLVNQLSEVSEVPKAKLSKPQKIARGSEEASRVGNSAI